MLKVVLLPLCVVTIALARKPFYRLAPHVRACARDDYVVLLDIERGKYLAVGGRQSRLLTELIEGWPSPPKDSPVTREGATPDAPVGSVETIVGRLIQKGLLTEEPPVGKPAAITGHAAMNTFPIFSLETSLRTYLRYLPSFAMACRRARRLHRNIRLSRVVARIRERRQRCGDRVSDEEMLEVLVRAHHHLRPLFYTWQDACLYDSLVLLEFLATYRIDAIWVFGVYTWPWIPHCWVRAGTRLLNDTPGNVGRYTVLAEF